MLIEFNVKKASSAINSSDVRIAYDGNPVTVNISSQNDTKNNVIEIDDKNDINDDFYNFDNFIFDNNKNSNSKSTRENVDDNNNNDFGQFEPNNDYQVDNYNSIFSKLFNDKN